MDFLTVQPVKYCYRMRDRLLKFLKKHFLFLITLSFIALIYSNILHAPFLLDDNNIRQDKTLQNATFLSIEFRHITHLSFALNNSLGWGVAGFHVFNIFLHMLNVILLYYLLHLTLRLSSQQSSMNGTFRFIPLFAATLFALHPIQTSAVTYIVQRAAVLATFFCLCSLIVYIKSVLSENRRLSLFVLYPGSFILLLFGLFSKEQVVVFPVIILLYDFFFLSSFRWRTLSSRLLPITGIFVLIALLVVIRFHGLATLQDILSIYARGDTPIPPRAWTALDVFWTPIQHVLTEFRVVSRYLSLLIFPLYSRMVFDFGPSYPLSTGLFSPPATLLSMLFIAGLVALSVLYAKKHPLLSFGILFYLVLISLESFVAVGSDLYFEHRNYLPGIGIFLSVSYLIVSLPRKIRPVKAWYLFIALCLSLSYLTYERNFAWQTVESLWQDTLKKAPHNKRAKYSIAYDYASNGRFHEAMVDLRDSIKIDIPSPTLDFMAYCKLLEVYSSLGMKKEMDATMKVLEDMLADRSRILLSDNSFNFFMGNAFFWFGDLKKSSDYLRKALPLILNGEYLFSIHLLLGQIELQYGNFQQSYNHFSAARVLLPDNPVPLLHLGDLAYLRDKDPKKAEGYYLQALQLNHRYLAAYLQLGKLYAAVDNNGAAIAILKKALLIAPENYGVLVSLGSLSFLQKDIDSAIVYFRRSAEIQPANPTNYYNLGQCYEKKGDSARARLYYSKFIELAPADEYREARDAVSKSLHQKY